MFIMLQRLDKDTKENLGGLFVVVDKIEALVPIVGEKCCEVHLVSGESHLTPFEVVEIVEMVEQYHQRDTQPKVSREGRW